MCAWGFKRKNSTGGLGLKRLAVAAVSAVFPHIEEVFHLFGQSIYIGMQGGMTWSLLFAPIYALGIAYAFQLYSKVPWKRYYVTALGCMVISILFAMMTLEGVRPFAPFINWRVAFGLVYNLDLTILFIAVTTLAVGWILPKFRRDISRIGLLSAIIYLLVLITFYNKADNFAEKYAEIFKLEIKEVYLLPQPISPFNWRIIVETRNNKLHDTLINLFRKSTKISSDTSTRAARIDSLYKPLDKAVWRIYRRFGSHNSPFAKQAWISMMRSGNQFPWLARYAVFKSGYKKDGNRCAVFKDLRFEGARKSKKGSYLICDENSGAVLYLSDAAGDFSKLEMMY